MFVPKEATRPDSLKGPAWIETLRPDRRLLRGRAYQRIKRGLDIGLLVLALPLLLPLMAVCWLAIKLTAPTAPAHFVQMRTGQGGRRFRMYKFRTMVPDAEEQKHTLAAINARQWPDFKVDDDPRVTRLGALLRQTSLDELPQVSTSSKAT
jgi:lipopolysaccharide/colanic/teichoic acid biosynthesis glycosyltransferase